MKITNRLNSCCLNYLIKAKKLETKNNLIDDKNYKDLVIFTRYEHRNSINMLSFCYHKLIEKI